MAWVLVLLGGFATLVTFINPYLRVVAAAPAILGGVLMLVAALAADENERAWVHIRSAAPAFLLGDVFVVIAALLGKSTHSEDVE